MDMGAGEYTILIVNIVFAFGCGYLLARRLARFLAQPDKIIFYLAMLILVYLVECIAFASAMATNVFSLALAFLWGIMLGLWWRRVRSSGGETLKSAFFFSLYSSLPAVSFLSVLVLLIINGWPLFTSEGGARFGVPDIVPWPMNTLVGFFAAVVLSAVFLKVSITTGIVALFLHGKEKK